MWITRTNGNKLHTHSRHILPHTQLSHNHFWCTYHLRPFITYKFVSHAPMSKFPQKKNNSFYISQNSFSHKDSFHTTFHFFCTILCSRSNSSHTMYHIFSWAADATFSESCTCLASEKFGVLAATFVWQAPNVLYLELLLRCRRFGLCWFRLEAAGDFQSSLCHWRDIWYRSIAWQGQEYGVCHQFQMLLLILLLLWQIQSWCGWICVWPFLRNILLPWTCTRSCEELLEQMLAYDGPSLPPRPEKRMWRFTINQMCGAFYTCFELIIVKKNHGASGFGLRGHGKYMRVFLGKILRLKFIEFLILQSLLYVYSILC